MHKLEPGMWYNGGKNGLDRRFVVSYGATKDYVVWAVMKDRLPLGGFLHTRCTSTKSFIKWTKFSSI
jgi:hypothetical protein